MYLSYEQVVVSNVVLTAAALTIPNNVTGVQLQADTADVRYTMDDATNPTVASGMILLTTEPPAEFLIEDLQRIRFIRSGGVDANLNVHYFAGADI